MILSLVQIQISNVLETPTARQAFNSIQAVLEASDLKLESLRRQQPEGTNLNALALVSSPLKHPFEILKGDVSIRSIPY